MYYINHERAKSYECNDNGCIFWFVMQMGEWISTSFLLDCCAFVFWYDISAQGSNQPCWCNCATSTPRPRPLLGPEEATTNCWRVQTIKCQQILMETSAAILPPSNALSRVIRSKRERTSGSRGFLPKSEKKYVPVWHTSTIETSNVWFHYTAREYRLPYADNSRGRFLERHIRHIASHTWRTTLQVPGTSKCGSTITNLQALV